MAAPDFSPLLSVVDMSAVASVVMSVAAVLAGVYVVLKGVRLVLSAIASPGSGATQSRYEWEADRIEAGDYVPRSVFEYHANGMSEDVMRRYAKRAAKAGWWG